MGELNVFDLKPLIKKHNINTFVETGTGKGFGLSYALKFSFEKIYSIEIMEELYNENREKFKDPRIKMILDNSVNGLKKALSECDSNKPVLFWLDAHFPGVDFQMDDYNKGLDRTINTPLEIELHTIMNTRPKNKDVFIIDDLRMYEDGPYEFGNWKDRLDFITNGIGFIEKIFNETHNIEKIYRHQGFLKITPKE